MVTEGCLLQGKADPRADTAVLVSGRPLWAPEGGLLGRKRLSPPDGPGGAERRESARGRP